MTTFKDLVPSAPEGRFDGIERPYTADDVAKLRGSVQIQSPARTPAAPFPGWVTSALRV